MIADIGVLRMQGEARTAEMVPNPNPNPYPYPYPYPNPNPNPI